MTALEDFINTIESTGGVHATEDGGYAPEGDRNWGDLGAAYVKACAELSRPIFYAEHHLYTREEWDSSEGLLPSAPTTGSGQDAAYSAWVHRQLQCPPKDG